MTLLEKYHYFDTELADPRTNNWALMSTIYPPILISIYLYAVFYAIPKFMRSRKAYELKEFIIAYNIYQVTICTYIVYGILTNGWLTHFDCLCQPVDPSNNPETLRMATLIWLLQYVKISEFIETIVFALRKKYKQISFLHVYHHISTYLVVWSGVKYFPGGAYTFPPLLNTSVHIIMYTYYLLTLIKVSWLQKGLAKFKPLMTKIQIIQLAILVLYGAHGMRPSCGLSVECLYMFIPNVVVVLLLFFNFYRKAFAKSFKSS